MGKGPNAKGPNAMGPMALMLGCALFFGCSGIVRAELRINHLQFVGSHNSYKQPMSGVYYTLLNLLDENAAKALQYSHEPLHRQLDLGLRKLELDVFYQGPSQGFVIGHVQVIDMNSHCSSLRDCLGQLLQWSEANPTHAPIWISFNAKDQSIGWLPDPQRFDAAAFAAMDQAIEDVLGPRLIRPAQVKPEATEQPVWPSLTDARGKFLLILDEGGAKRDLYQDQWLRRPMFVNQAASHPAAAVMIVNDPIAEGPRIRQLVSDGFMVRTRADADTLEARQNDTRRRDAAFASGAQAISTDYYLPTNLFGNDYRVTIAGGLRCNPVNAPTECEAELQALSDL